MSELGSFALLLAMILSAYTTIIAFIGARKNLSLLVFTAERAVIAVSVLLSISVYALIVVLVNSDFTVEYVVNYTNRELPAFYKITALWAGHSGSLLFWSWLLSIFSAVVIFQYQKKFREMMPYVLMVLMGTNFFFNVLIYFISNPFNLLGIQGTDGLIQPFAPDDGHGLNPLLQHPAMAIHPPVLYIGYVGFIVPFGFALAALATGKLGDVWMKTTRRWTIFSWLFLGAGILLGAKWAYVELGWGGYWAWDPVENASLMPWLTGTAYLHSVMIQEKRGMLKVWNMALVIITFLLCIFGTFLTRSGVVSSVHAFAESSIGTLFALFLGILVVISAGLFLFRLPLLKSENKLDSLLSRESSFLFNNLVFLIACFSVLWGTIFPVISEAVQGVKITVGAPFFNRINVPLGLFLLFLTGVGPYFAWRRTSLRSLRRSFLLPSVGALLMVVTLLIFGMYNVYAMISFSLSLFVILIILIEFHRSARYRSVQTGKSYFVALVNMIRRNTRRYGAYIIHFSIALMFIGITGSAFNQDIQKEIQAGESFVLGNYKFVVDKINESRTPNYMAQQVTLSMFKGNKQVTILKPEKRYYLASEQPSSEVSIYSTLKEDIYAVFSGMNQDDKKAVIRLYLNPLVAWLWIGGLVLVIGTIIVMIPEKKSKRQSDAVVTPDDKKLLGELSQ